MALKLAKAEPGQGYLKAGLYGESGSGKTFTALLIAEYLAGKDSKKRRIAYVDTERGTDFYSITIPERKIHPNAFDFDRSVTRSVLDVRDFLVDPATAESYCVVVLDSVTHLWEAAKESYSGPKTSIGTFPVQAWQVIKRPWKQMMEGGLNGQFHFLICGRLKIDFEEDEVTGKLSAVGTRIKAEGETGYEPHVLIHMYQQREEEDASGLHPWAIKAFVEKDRSGILMGQTLTFPRAEDFAPLYGYLSGTQDAFQTLDNAAEKDATKSVEEKEAREREQVALYEAIREQIQRARNVEELRVAWSLTKGKKLKLESYFEKLEVQKNARKDELTERAIGTV